MNVMTKKEIDDAIKKEKAPKKEDKKHEKQDLLETIQRLQADFENFRKRVDRDRQDFCNFAGRSMVEKMLPALDNFELALKNKNHENKEEFVKAIEMVHQQIMDIMENEGLEKIKTEGNMFDPELHTPIVQEESDKKPNTILEDVQAGYMFKDKVLRHSKVKIAKEKQKEERKESKKEGEKENNHNNKNKPMEG